MAHLLVLGDGWVGRAVVEAASGYSVSVIDPPLHPVFCNRDRDAMEALQKFIQQNRTTTVINACGRLRGTEAELNDANAEFPRWLCMTLSGTGVRLIHVGSASEYGDPQSAQRVTENSPQRAIGPYACSKAAGTEAVLRARDAGLDATVVRVFNIVGYPIPAVSPIYQWLTDLRSLGSAKGSSIDVWWPPTTRDFVMIEDVATALLDLASVEESQGLVNLCSGVGLQFGSIAQAIATELGSSTTVRSLEKPGIETVVGDPGLLRKTIGWVPAMSLEALAARVVGADRVTPPGGGSPANR